MNAMDYIPYERGAYYIFDRGYVDYKRLYFITKYPAYFVIRAKKNLKFRRMYSNKIDPSTGVRCDQIVQLTEKQTSLTYPDQLRRSKYYYPETNRTFFFLTNNIELVP